MSIAKEEAKRFIEKLPDHVTWDDIMYVFYVKKKLAVALKAAEEGRIVSHDDVKKRFLPQWGFCGLNQLLKTLKVSGITLNVVQNIMHPCSSRELLKQ